MSKEDILLNKLSRVEISLDSIATSLSHSFGPMKQQKIIDPSDEWEKQNRERVKETALLEQIRLLKEQNLTAVRSAWIAVAGVVVTAIFSVLDFFFKH